VDTCLRQGRRHQAKCANILYNNQLQVIVCIVIACVAAVNSYPGYYGHGGYEHLSDVGEEKEQHVSVKARILIKQ
jgi:hypothetical protein